MGISCHILHMGDIDNQSIFFRLQTWLIQLTKTKFLSAAIRTVAYFLVNGFTVPQPRPINKHKIHEKSIDLLKESWEKCLKYKKMWILRHIKKVKFNPFLEVVSDRMQLYHDTCNWSNTGLIVHPLVSIGTWAWICPLPLHTKVSKTIYIPALALFDGVYIF